MLDIRRFDESLDFCPNTRYHIIIFADKPEFAEAFVMDFIINMFADIADIFFDLWANKTVDRFARGKGKNEAPDNVG